MYPRKLHHRTQTRAHQRPHTRAHPRRPPHARISRRRRAFSRTPAAPPAARQAIRRRSKHGVNFAGAQRGASSDFFLYYKHATTRQRCELRRRWARSRASCRTVRTSHPGCGKRYRHACRQRCCQCRSGNRAAGVPGLCRGP